MLIHSVDRQNKRNFFLSSGETLPISSSGKLAIRSDRSPCTSSLHLSPHFSPSIYCGGGSGRVYSVAPPWAPRHTVKYACGALRRAPCIHTRLHRLATKYGEKCGLARFYTQIMSPGIAVLKPTVPITDENRLNPLVLAHGYRR